MEYSIILILVIFATSRFKKKKPTNFIFDKVEWYIFKSTKKGIDILNTVRVHKQKYEKL